MLFPAPGGPVMPMRRARPSRACSAPSSRSKPGAMVLDDADRARQRGLAPRVEVREQGVVHVGSELGSRRGLVVLVADVADELLEQVLERHQADGVLLRRPARSRGAGSRRSMRKSSSLHGVSSSAMATGRSAGGALAAHLEHVEGVDHPDDVVDRSRS